MHTRCKWELIALEWLCDTSLSVSPSERLRRLIEQIERADQLGLDVFGVGEHHRREFLDSAPVVILGAAVAERNVYVSPVP